MEMRLLKYFLAVAEEGSIVKAAAALHITQPTLSRQLMDMEKELGTKLLIRSRKQLTLTDSGFLFQQRAKEIIELSEKMCRELAEQDERVSGTILIACVETGASEFLTGIISEFHRCYPMVKFDVHSVDGNGIRESLDRGSADLGILLEPVEAAKYDYVRLPVSETWGFAVRGDSPLAEKDALTTDDIRGLPLIVPKRTIVVEEIGKWLGVESEHLNIVASYNLPTNGLLFVQKKFRRSHLCAGDSCNPPDARNHLRSVFPGARHGSCSGVEEEPGVLPVDTAVFGIREWGLILLSVKIFKSLYPQGTGREYMRRYLRRRRKCSPRSRRIFGQNFIKYFGRR